MADPLDECLVLEVGAGALREAAVDVALLAALSLLRRSLRSGCAFISLAVLGDGGDAGKALDALG